MNNLLSYCGLFDAKIRASDIDLPVIFSYFHNFIAKRDQKPKTKNGMSKTRMLSLLGGIEIYLYSISVFVNCSLQAGQFYVPYGNGLKAFLFA